MVLVGWLTFLLGTGSFSGPPDMNAVFNAIAKANIGQVTLAGLLGVVVGSVMHPFQFLLVRMLEGYWTNVPILRRLQYIGIEINRRRMRRLIRAHEPTEKWYPPSEHDLLPTRLGNALRAAERYAGKPYGLESVTMLPRLFPIVSPSVSAIFVDLRNQLDVAARYTVVLAIITSTGLAVLATDGPWLLLPVVAALLMWASYRAAIRNAVSYGNGLRLLFELHHGQLVQALGWKVPESIDELRTLAEGLGKWLDDDGAPPEGYIGPAASEKAKEVTSPQQDPTAQQ